MEETTLSQRKKPRGRLRRAPVTAEAKAPLAPSQRLDILLHSGAALALEAQWAGGTFPAGYRQEAIQAAETAISVLGVALEFMKRGEHQISSMGRGHAMTSLSDLLGTAREHSHHVLAAALSLASAQAAIAADGISRRSDGNRLRDRLAMARDHLDAADEALAAFIR